MARKQYVTVTDHPQRKQNTLYEMRVTGLELHKKSKEITAKLEDVVKDQHGRFCVIPHMPPLHPGNQTSLFLSACGVNANKVGVRICLNDLIDSHIGVKFNKSGEPLEFIQLKEKNRSITNVMELANEDHISESS